MKKLIDLEARITEKGVEFTFRDDNSTVFLTWFKFIWFIIENPSVLWTNPQLIKVIVKFWRPGPRVSL